MKLNVLQEYEPKSFGGLVSKNHLGQIFMEEGVQDVPGPINQIYQVNYGTDLENFLRQFPVQYFESDDDFRWRLQGQDDKNIPLVGAFLMDSAGALTAVAATDQVGRAGSLFVLRFPEAYFTGGLIAGERNEVYPINIKSGPTPAGNYFDYVCELFTGDTDLYIPFEELAAGKRFSVEWSTVEQTMSKEGTMPNYNSPFSMRNCFTMLRKENTIPGNMINRPLAFPFQDYKTKKTLNTWIQYTDWQLYKQFRAEKNRMLMYAQTNRAADGTFKQVGSSGFVKQQGSGIKQQMAPANISYYNSFDIDWFTDKLLQMCVGKIDEANRGVLVRCGAWGRVQFSRALEDHAQMYTLVRDETRIYSVGKNGQQGYKGQFVEYMGPEGTKVSLMVDNMYDDIVRNKIMHPSGKGVAESYTYDIFALGTDKGKPNIQLVQEKGMESHMRYIPGMRDPFSATGGKSQMAASRVDGYELHIMDNCGAIINDPTKTMSLVHNSLA